AGKGGKSGSVVNVITKSGTNDLHGNVYEFFRNTKLNANPYCFTAVDGIPCDKPQFNQNQFGGTFGGPIVKDRTFFFASYEGRRVVHGISSDPVTVPTAAERAGDFSNTPFTGAIADDLVASILSERCGVNAHAGDLYSDLFPGSQVPVSCFDPVAVDIMNEFVPCPSAASGCTNLDPTVNPSFRAIPN